MFNSKWEEMLHKNGLLHWQQPGILWFTDFLAPFIWNSQGVWLFRLHCLLLLLLLYAANVTSVNFLNLNSLFFSSHLWFTANLKWSPFRLSGTKWHPFYSELPLILGLTWPAGVTHIAIWSCQMFLTAKLNFHVCLNIINTFTSITAVLNVLYRHLLRSF